MTDITAKMVSDLRARTGAGMMQCKNALKEANGDMDTAIDVLRKAGQASAVKKGSRIAAEGLVLAAMSADSRLGVIVEINCETDFVAREERFKKFCLEVSSCALISPAKDATELLQQKVSNGNTVEAARLELVAQIGENVAVRRMRCVEATGAGLVAAYLHGGDPIASRIGAVVAIDTQNESLAKDIAMHVAAMRPEYLSEAQVPADRIAKEKEILLAQAKEANAGKPPEILEKIIAGKMSKFLKEITLVGQPFVKNPDLTIGQLLAAEKTNVTDYVRYEVGEGIEKKTTDFVAEVMQQVHS